VHEGPQNINWQIGKRSGNVIPLEAGMVTSDEPGFYLEGEYGIRLENDIVAVEKYKDDYETFLGFDVLTLAPFDMSPINWDDMSEEEIKILNDYHQMVYDKVSPYLDEETRTWLFNYIKK
ncbi:MAG: M24 family metallopeptidase C-terminal domain-containing protein, partial [Lachnospiraceae bacterium]|nr:M24 family metallopeptidase C-terminal domain-containing protein [Lachnospiraceae bacterium]